MDREIRRGVKTFFLNADASLSPDPGQLETLFLGGFEVYPLPASTLISAADQIDCLVGLFQELILFVNVDSTPENNPWPQLLLRLSKTYGKRVRFGVLHHETDPVRRAQMERFYLVEAQVQAGCIHLNRSHTPDMPKLQRILLANDANGRRKAIRMVCNSRLSTVHQGLVLEAKVMEVSITNFLCVFLGQDPALEESTRVTGLRMALGGATLVVDAIVLLKRTVGGSREILYVFGFSGGEGPLGLGPDKTAILVGLIRNYTTRNVTALVDRAFQQRWRQRQLSAD